MPFHKKETNPGLLRRMAGASFGAGNAQAEPADSIRGRHQALPGPREGPHVINFIPTLLLPEEGPFEHLNKTLQQIATLNA